MNSLIKLLMDKYEKSIHIINRDHQEVEWLRIFKKRTFENYNETIVRIAIMSQCIYVYDKYDIRLGMYALCDPQQFDQFWTDLDETIRQLDNLTMVL